MIEIMSESAPHSATVKPSIPLSVKLAYTGFMAVIIPHYWRVYGPTNFLYFCDVAMLCTWIGLWTESRLLISMAATGILVADGLWTLDFLFGLVGGHLTGMTDYMFNPELSLLSRGLSLFHIVLPLVLVWAVRRLGYDPRGLPAWTIVAWILMFVCYFFMPAPPAPADNPNLPVNIDYVYGLSDKAPQTWMPGPVYFVSLLFFLPVVIFWPTHLVLKRFFTVPSGNQLG